MRRIPVLLAALALAGCGDANMYAQKKVLTWDRNEVLPNKTAMQLPVIGTVPRDEPNQVAPQPQTITAALVERGHQQYDIFCTPCHGLTGAGNGMIVQRGFPHPPQFTDDRLIKAKAQHFYDVHHQRQGRDVLLRRPRDPGRSMGRRRLHPCAAAVAEAGRRRPLVRRQVQARQGHSMSRASTPLAVAGAVWVAALVVVIIVAIATGWSVTAHGYFAGWLVAVSLPLGALPVLMVLDLLGAAETSTATALRLLLAALPVLALLIIPVLLDLSSVFPWPAGSLPGGSLGRAAEGLRPAVVLTRLLRDAQHRLSRALGGAGAVLSCGRRRGRSGTATIAGAGLALHFVIGTLAAYDWWMSLDQAFMSSAYGLLVIAAQATFALTVASLAVLVTERAELERAVRLGLLAVLFLAAFIQFSQYLVVWSANLPKEIVWYQARWVGALGPVFVIGVPVLLALAFLVLIPAPVAAMRLPALVALGAILLVVFLDLACLACPRGTFTFGGVGLLLAFLIVVGGMGAGCAAVLGGRLAKGRSP